MEDIYIYLRELAAKDMDHEVLLHGTTLSSLVEIAKNRHFIPQRKNGSDALANHYEEKYFLDYIFFTNDEENAGHYSTLACSNQGEYDNKNIQTIVGAIIPQHLLLPDLCDAPQATDWRESLNQIKSVCVKNELQLPAEKVFLLFTDYDTGEPLYLTTNLNGEKAFKEAMKIQNNRYD